MNIILKRLPFSRLYHWGICHLLILEGTLLSKYYLRWNHFIVWYLIRHIYYQISTLSEISSIFDSFTFLYVIMFDVTMCLSSCIECKDIMYESTLFIFITLTLYFSTFIKFSDHMLHCNKHHLPNHSTYNVYCVISIYYK